MRKRKKRIIIISLSAVLMVLIGVCAGYHLCYDKLITAIQTGENKTAKQLLRIPFISLDQAGGSSWLLRWLAEFSGQTPLEAACETGNAELVELLIQKGANPKQVRQGQFSLVYLTLQEYHPQDLAILKLLIDNGADPKSNPTDFEDYSLLQAALLSPSNEKPTDNWNGGHYSQENAEAILKIYQYLEKKIGDIKEVRGVEGETVLMNASLMKNLELMEYLTDSGKADVNARDNAGETSLFYIVPENTPYDKEWKRQAVDLLLQKGADRTIRDRQGKTAYDYAVEDNDSFLAGLIKPEAQ